MFLCRHNIIKDLEAEGYIHRRREGRANHYQVNLEAPLRRRERRGVVVGELLKVLGNSAE